MVTFKWAQEPLIRQFSFNQQEISKTEHERWFDGKITDSNCHYFILETSHGKAIGSFRIDVLPEQSTGVISYLLAPEFHGKGWGIALLVLGQDAAKQTGIKTLIGEVMAENSSSSAIFVKLGYDAEVLSDRIRYQKSL
jgi:RimJ/RimL family protein N-acetyltransferase